MGPTTRWMESSVVGRVFEFFFFFQKEFFTPGQKPLCQGDCLISLLKGCQRWLRFESSFWCWRGQGRQRCQPSVTASAVSRGDAWAPQWNLESYFLRRNRGGGWGWCGAGEVQMRRREERHRSNGHREVYHISIQPESEKLSQSQLGVFWRKKLTRGKNRINITALNQYIKPSDVLLRGCSRKLGPAVILIPPDCVCKHLQVRGIQTVGMKGWHCGPCLRNQLGFA